MDKAKIALAGTGWWATTTHLPALQQHPDAQIVAICDLDADKLRKAADVFNIETTYTDVETMLANEDLDGVMVATHHAAHYDVAKACLERDLHIFIEKPMTLLAEQARELVELAEEKDRQIALGYNHNHSGLTIRARDLVQSEQFGKVQYAHGLFSQPVYDLLAGDAANFESGIQSPGDVYSDPQRSGGGLGHLQITHLAGMLFFVTGLQISRVRSMMANHGLAVDLVVSIMAEFEGGALGSFGGSGNLPGGGRSCSLTVCCERGWITLDDALGMMVVRRPGRDAEEYEDQAIVDPNWLTFSPTNNFVDVILGRAENNSGGVIGWRATELLDAAYRSANRDGAAVHRRELYSEQTS